MEGISQEAIALAGHLKLNRLIVLFDDNGISIDGPLSLSDSVDQVKRFEAAGWNARAHRRARSRRRSRRRIATAQKSDRPTLIACKTTIGFGAPTKAGKSSVARLAARRRRDQGRAREARLDVTRRSRSRPTSSTAWRAAGQRGEVRAQGLGRAPRRAAGRQARRVRAPHQRRPAARRSPTRCAAPRRSSPPSRRTSRRAWRRENALDVLTAAVPEMIGGSADLTGSNNTRTKAMKAMSAADYAGTLHPLRHPRARHGGGDERHGAAWRRHPVFRHVPGVLRLLPPVDPARRADGRARRST